jgi:hypothetical protein
MLAMRLDELHGEAAQGEVAMLAQRALQEGRVTHVDLYNQVIAALEELDELDVTRLH